MRHRIAFAWRKRADMLITAHKLDHQMNSGWLRAIRWRCRALVVVRQRARNQRNFSYFWPDVRVGHLPRAEQHLHAQPVPPADVVAQRLEAVLAHEVVQPLAAEVVEMLELRPNTGLPWLRRDNARPGCHSSAPRRAGRLQAIANCGLQRAPCAGTACAPARRRS